MTGLTFTVRTPHEVVFEQAVESARVPAESGQVGFRPGVEPMVLAVEPGLVLLQVEGRERYLATAGGMLRSDRDTALLLTPFAVSGDSGEAVLASLDALLATPDSELLARRELGELEQRIIHELRQERGGMAGEGCHAG